MIKIYTDGSCIGNPGKGGWAAIILNDGKKTEIKGSKKDTTNNQMELLAPIEALKKIPKGSKVQIFTDSKYVKSGITEWIHNWKKNGWKTANKKEVSNKELWTELDLLNNEFEISWNWIKAHSTDELNNGKKTELKGSKKDTTNNQMELLAPIEALKKIPKGSKVQIFTDSKYVKSGITEWIYNWKKNGWKTANKKEVSNKALWTELDLLNNEFEISWRWVKAHSTDELNNEVDLLAKNAANL